MKLGFVCVSIMLLSTSAYAEIYKWKDKDGSIRYSDIPPPAYIKNEQILGKKTPKTLSEQAPVDADVAQDVKEGAASNRGLSLNKAETAAKRANDAEVKKKLNETKQAELKNRQDNCLAARKNFALFNNGGRIATIDANGQRQYLGDDDIANGKASAQLAMENFCVD
jgi:hypothetical protein